MPIRMVEGVFHLVGNHPYAAFFMLILLEESGVPLPVPGDGLMMFAGYRVAAGHLSFLAVFVTMEAATLIGASILRLIGRWGGRPLLNRYGRYVRLDRQRLEQMEAWLARHGALAIMIGRLIPGLRLPTSVAAGVFDVPYRVFLPFAALGSTLYILFFLSLGLGLGKETSHIVRLLRLNRMLVALLVLALLLLIALGVWRWRKSIARWLSS